MIRGQCGIILEALRRLNRPVVGTLQPPIEPAVVAAALRGLKLPSVKEYEELLGWHNGTSKTGVARLSDIWFFPGYYLVSLEEAVNVFELVGSYWNNAGIPLFTNDGGDFFVLNCSNATILLCEAESAGPRTVHRSLPVMLEVMASCFDEGAYFVDSRNQFRANHALEREIAKSKNPGVKHWLKA
jgi:hypothetical protein